MAQIQYGGTPFDTDLIVFDKDGTLVDFAEMWGARIHNAVEALCRAVDADIILRGRLYLAVGYDPEFGTFFPQSPAITAPMHDMYIIPAVVLYQHGYGWLDAELLVEEHYKAVLDAPLKPEEIRATTDLTPLFEGLHAAGVEIAVVTSDDRTPTLQTLDHLGLTDAVGFLVCADDGLPGKPAPDGLLAACKHFNADPRRVAMIGDSTTDLVMAKRAGVGLRVGVLSGVMDERTLAPQAHLVLPHVGLIRA